MIDSHINDTFEKQLLVGPLFKMGNHVALKLVYLVGMILWNTSKDGNRYKETVLQDSVYPKSFNVGFYQVNAPLQVFRKTVGGRDEESVGVHKRI